MTFLGFRYIALKGMKEVKCGKKAWRSYSDTMPKENALIPVLNVLFF